MESAVGLVSVKCFEHPGRRLVDAAPGKITEAQELLQQARNWFIVRFYSIRRLPVFDTILLCFEWPITTIVTA